MADIDTSWTWNFTGPTTMSKAHSRAGLPKDVAWDLIGFDGNEPGCLRTHPGFAQITSFTPTDGFLDLKPVNVLTSATTYVHGFVWFEYVGGSSSVKVYGKFNTGTSWINHNNTNNPGALIATFTGIGSPSGIEVDVQVMGRYLLIFMRGQKPKLVLITVSTTWSATAVDAGPGEAPKIAITTLTATTPTNSRINPANSDVCVSVHSSGIGTHVPSGNYSIAVQYMSTTTGRKSALSNTVTIAAGSTNNHISYQLLRMTLDYDRLLIYRSVNQGGNSGASVYGAGALHLDQVVNLITAGLTTNTATTQVWNASTDEQLVYQDVYVDKGKCDTYAPKGGIAGFMGNTLFVSRISDSSSALPSGISGVTPESPPRGLGDMRWSNTGEMQPENFNPSNRWVPRTAANEILNMRQVGLYLMGFSSDRIYRIGRSGQFIRVEEGHIGYGLQARQGIESVGSMVYFVSGGGLKAISSEGQIEDVTALDRLLNVEWLETRSEVQLAFDAYGQCLTVLNPDTGNLTADGSAAILWFGTNRVTQLVDLPFFRCVTGYYQGSGETGVQRRALFLKYNSDTSIGVYIVDHGRQFNSAGHNLCGGILSSSDPCIIWNCNLDPPASIAETAFGCMAYNVETGQPIPVNELYNEWTAYPEFYANQVFSIAPIVQQWVGGNVGMQIQPGEPEFKDFFRQKQISSCRSYYETLASPPVSNLVNATEHDTEYPLTATWQAVVYRGMELVPYATAKPLEHSGVAMAGFNLDLYDSSGIAGRIANAPFGKHGVLWSSLSPGWRCVLSGVDVRLLAFSAVGRILDSDRRYV